MSIFASGLRRSIDRRYGPLAMLLAVVAFATACTKDAAPIAVAQLVFGKVTDSVLVARTYQLAVTALDASGNVVNRKPKYSTTTPLLAEVDANGLVTPKLAGDAQFRAELDGKVASFLLRIATPAANVVVTPVNSDIPVGQVRSMTVSVTSSTGSTVAGRVIEWRTSNPAVATVNSQGVVSAVAIGSAVITAETTFDQVRGNATVNVIPLSVASVQMTPSTNQLVRISGTLQVNATARDAGGSIIAGRPVNWSSSNATVASVTSAGLVTGISVGTAVIQAEVDGRTGTVNVIVTEVPAKTVTLAPTTLALNSGQIQQLIPTVIDSLNRQVSSLANRSVVWASSNVVVAGVAQTGVITGVSGGTANISVTVDGIRSNDVVVTVTDLVASVQLSPSVAQLLRIGTSVQLTATPRNSLGQPLSGRTINWSSTNPTIASVSQSGLVNGISAGSVLITAESEGRTASVNVSVTPIPIASVTLPVADTLVVFDVKQFVPVVVDTAGNTVTSFLNRSVLWESQNQPIATVNNSGIVNTSAEGTAPIRVIIDGVSSNFMQLRASFIDRMTVAPDPMTLSVNQSQAFIVTYLDVIGNVLKSTRKPTFESLNNPIATVSAGGLVSARAPGQADIRVTLTGLPPLIAKVTVQP